MEHIRSGIDAEMDYSGGCFTHLRPNFDTAVEFCQEGVTTRGPEKRQGKQEMQKVRHEPSDLANKTLGVSKDTM
jgi:hypothetical protein